MWAWIASRWQSILTWLGVTAAVGAAALRNRLERKQLNRISEDLAKKANRLEVEQKTVAEAAAKAAVQRANDVEALHEFNRGSGDPDPSPRRDK